MKQTHAKAKPAGTSARVEAAAKPRYLALLEMWLPDGRLKGREYYALNPNRDDDEDLGSFKFNIDDGKWADFAAAGNGHKGIGIISYYAYVFNVNSVAATERVAEDIGLNGATPPKAKKGGRPAKKPPIELAVWPHDDDPALDRFKLAKLPPPAAAWFYCNRASGIQAAAVRYNMQDGSKQFRTWSCAAVNNGFGGKGVVWKPQAPPEPRSLYHLDLLDGEPSWPVVVTEGEKSADAVTRLFEAIGVTSLNGAGSPHKTDWAPLKGRTVIIWPDNDKAGEGYAREVTALVREAGAASVKIVEIPAGWPKGWDLADLPPEGAAHDDLKEMLEAAEEPSVVLGASHDELTIGFVDKHRDELRYIAERGWAIYGPHGWDEDKKKRTFELARLFARDAAPHVKPSEAKNVRSAQTRAAILSMAEHDSAFATIADEWDTDPKALNTLGGILDLVAGSVRPRSPADYVLKCAAVSPAKEECPKWAAFLDKVIPDKDVQTYLQRACGYSLTGLVTEHAMFFLYGTGRNGKGVFLRTIRGILGSYAKVAAMETFTASRNERHSQELAGLVGARLVIAQEPQEGVGWNETRIKTLTGGDPITARFMHKNDFTYDPQFKLWVAGNHKPTLRAVDPAIRSRLQLVPFEVFIKPEERNPNLDEELKEEWPAILQWMVEGCLEWQRIGLAPPAIVIDTTEEYFNEEDTLALWLDEACVVAGEVDPLDPASRPLPADHFTSTTLLYNSWRAWTEGARFFTGSMKMFSRNLRTRFEYVEKPRPAGFKGIRVRRWKGE